MSNTNDEIWTKIDYTVKDPKHEHEKPYDIRYDTGGVMPSTNLTNEAKQVVIHDFRSLQDPRNFEEYGFSLERLGCTLTDTVFHEQKSIEEVYYPVIEKILWDKFPNADAVLILEYNLRKRHAEFPAGENEINFEHAQPVTLAHIDFSLDSATKTACAAFGIPQDRCRRLLAVNFWKSLQGPGNDWPLALCDHRTINHASETIVADVVYHNRFTENEKVYYNSNHKWYYFKNLGDDEIVMFLQKDSDIEGGGGVVHSSFNNPRVEVNAPLRASIEMRAFVIFA
ncbi:hypothetical protein CC78DRAFT_565707 [Lojkania enalia]|uniref:Methyltransferase n=1 Tax=Lojkania enalia TaxID=147567 RepID=A0A9P4KJ54_9PLEO|nr:hypothetical protein CC78DRAFT_565707 [Didymosphaeria enalia]